MAPDPLRTPQALLSTEESWVAAHRHCGAKLGELMPWLGIQRNTLFYSAARLNVAWRLSEASRSNEAVDGILFGREARLSNHQPTAHSSQFRLGHSA